MGLQRLVQEGRGVHFDFSLSKTDTETIRKLDQGESLYDPETVEFLTGLGKQAGRKHCEMRQLLAYFSRADENDFSGALRTISIGNMEPAAKALQTLTGADLFKIDLLQPYARDYNTCIAQAQDDQLRDARPELKEYPDSL